MGKNRIVTLMTAALVLLATAAATSCNKGESYAEQLEDERMAANAYLSGYRVVNDIPADSVFETGTEAPYYRLEPEGNVYMQVVRAGDRDSMAVTGDKIFFRFTRMDLNTWYEEGYIYQETNSLDMEYAADYFYFNDFTKQASTASGYGLQLPLAYIGINSEVNLIIKSQYGPSDEISEVVPYRWNVRYFKSAL